MKNHLLQSWETNEILRFWNNKDTTTNAPSQAFPLFSISSHWLSLHHSEYQPSTTQIKMHSNKPKNLTFPTEIPDLENSNRLTAFKLWKCMIPILFLLLLLFFYPLLEITWHNEVFLGVFGEVLSLSPVSSWWFDSWRLRRVCWRQEIRDDFGFSFLGWLRCGGMFVETRRDVWEMGKYERDNDTCYSLQLPRVMKWWSDEVQQWRLNAVILLFLVTF